MVRAIRMAFGSLIGGANSVAAVMVAAMSKRLHRRATQAGRHRTGSIADR
jgi:hypothetical protein